MVLGNLNSWPSFWGWVRPEDHFFIMCNGYSLEKWCIPIPCLRHNVLDPFLQAIYSFTIHSNSTKGFGFLIISSSFKPLCCCIASNSVIWFKIKIFPISWFSQVLELHSFKSLCLSSYDVVGSSFYNKDVHQFMALLIKTYSFQPPAFKHVIGFNLLPSITL